MFRRKIKRIVKNMARLILIAISLLLFYSFFYVIAVLVNYLVPLP
jgi:ACR3 family arsenite efflux pump ArsB